MAKEIYEVPSVKIRLYITAYFNTDEWSYSLDLTYDRKLTERDKEVLGDHAVPIEDVRNYIGWLAHRYTMVREKLRCPHPSRDLIRKTKLRMHPTMVSLDVKPCVFVNDYDFDAYTDVAKFRSAAFNQIWKNFPVEW